MKKMNVYEAPVAEMIEIEAVNAMMITSQTGNGGGTGGNTGGGTGNPSF